MALIACSSNWSKPFFDKSDEMVKTAVEMVTDA